MQRALLLQITPEAVNLITTTYQLTLQVQLIQYYNHTQFSFTLLRLNHSKDETGNISGSTGSTTLTSNTIPSHGHTIDAGVPDGCNPSSSGIVRGNRVAVNNFSTSNTGGGQSHDHTLSANFSGSANSVLQPYLVLIYIIKT